jgi:replicative DNA helicase
MKPDKRMASREQEISSISWALKSMAKELQVPVIALSQLSRKCEDRTNKRPVLGDLRESGAIEQDADVILSLYSPARYYELSDDKDYNKNMMSEEDYKLMSELGILKNRNGASGFFIKEIFYKDRSYFA